MMSRQQRRIMLVLTVVMMMMAMPVRTAATVRHRSVLLIDGNDMRGGNDALSIDVKNHHNHHPYPHDADRPFPSVRRRRNVEWEWTPETTHAQDKASPHRVSPPRPPPRDDEGDDYFNDAGERDDSTDAHSSSSTRRDGALIEVSMRSLLGAAVPLLLLSGLAHWLGLPVAPQAPWTLPVAVFRAGVQLSVLGHVLPPLFDAGRRDARVVVLYLVFTTALAAREATARLTYTDPQRPYDWPCRVALVFAVVLGAVLLTTVTFWVTPDPLWDPTYVIPMAGMLLGNALNGVTLSLNALLTSLVERQVDVERYLSYGASPREALAPWTAVSVQTGMRPMINSLLVIGVITIPGMMTGQILGGSTVEQAARYQLLLCYLIGTTSLAAILLMVWLVQTTGFCRKTGMVQAAERLRRRAASDEDGILPWLKRHLYGLVDRIHVGGKGLPRVTSWPRFFWGRAAHSAPFPFWVHPMTNCCDDEETAALTRTSNNAWSIDDAKTDHSPADDTDSSSRVIAVRGEIKIHKLISNHAIAAMGSLSTTVPAVSPRSPHFPLLEVRHLTKSILVAPSEEHDRDDHHHVVKPGVKDHESVNTQGPRPSTTARSPSRRVLFHDVSFVVQARELFAITGPSGAGKSQLMRILAGLTHYDGQMGPAAHRATELLSGGAHFGATKGKRSMGPDQWRRHIRYVSPNKIDLPGTPRQLMERLCQLRSWQESSPVFRARCRSHDGHSHSPFLAASIASRSSSASLLPPPTLTEMVRQVQQYLVEWDLSAQSIDHEWSTLSGGESQRVSLALALASRPRLLLLDEATSALDLDTKRKIEATIRRWVLEPPQLAHDASTVSVRSTNDSNNTINSNLNWVNDGCSVLWITHDPDQLDRLRQSS